VGLPPAPSSGHEGEVSLAQLLPHAKELRFTAIPLLIVLALALGIGGLIRLARHRA
jgi:hypothetical protein